MSRRGQIEMSREEALAFLEQERTCTLATNGRDGFPHLMPLWYVVRDGELWAWTYAVSQKVRNLERDARGTVQVEAGDEYAQLRGVMLKVDVVLHRDAETVVEIGAELAARYGGVALDDSLREAMAAQARKRVGLQFVERSRATWDHRKLGGTY